MLRALFFVVPAALMVGTAQAMPKAGTLDRATAMTAPVEELAKTALAGSAHHLVEVTRPGHIGLGGPELRGLHFATAAIGTGYPGLCKATTIQIAIGDSATPIYTATRYKVVGDLATDIGNGADEGDLTRKCAEAGRVIPTDSSDFGQATFFEFAKGDDYEAWRAARALQFAIAAARSGSPVICVPPPDIDVQMLAEMAADDPEVIEQRLNQEGCAQARDTLAALSLSKLLQIESTPCWEMAKKSLCLSAHFLRYADFNHQIVWQVKLRYQDDEGDDRDDLSVSDLELQPIHSWYD